MNPQYVTVPTVPPAGTAPQTSTIVQPEPINRGGVVVQASYLTGFEIVSGNNTSQDDIVIAMDETRYVNDVRFDMSFDSEMVDEAFTVRTWNYDKTELVTFGEIGTGAQGTIISIDMYFEFESVLAGEAY